MQREIQDLKTQQNRLLEQRQKDFIDQEILESRIAPVKLLCDQKERPLLILDEQRRRKDDAAAAETRIAEFCERMTEGLEDASFPPPLWPRRCRHLRSWPPARPRGSPDGLSGCATGTSCERRRASDLGVAQL